MRLEDYFDFQKPDDVRIRGTRIGVESVLDQYVNEKKTAEQIAEMFPSTSLDQVYATILLYLRDRERWGGYLKEYCEYCERARKERDRDPRNIEVRKKLQAHRSVLHECRLQPAPPLPPASAGGELDSLIIVDRRPLSSSPPPTS